MARSAAVDPMEKFRFQVSWSNQAGSEPTALVRLGFHDVQMPKRTTGKILYREGIDQDVSMHSPGLSAMEDVVMSRGLIIADPNNEFYKWASAVANPSAGLQARAALAGRPANSASNNFRKDLTVEMLDREGNIARRWVLYQAWPVAFNPGSDLNASEDGDKSMESLTVTYEDFQEVALDGSAPIKPSADYP